MFTAEEMSFLSHRRYTSLGGQLEAKAQSNKYSFCLTQLVYHQYHLIKAPSTLFVVYESNSGF